MERKATEQLLKWKIKRNHKPFLITGAPRCGKTYLARKFGEENFPETAYFDLEADRGIRSVFEQARESAPEQAPEQIPQQTPNHTLDVTGILHTLGDIVYGKEIIPGKTLVIFDGIHTCPRALQALKAFHEKLPELHLIATGSITEAVLRANNISLAEDKLERLELYPMSFEEFVTADGGENYIRGIMQLAFDRALPDLYTEPLEKYYKNYLITGGMPEAVQTWIETHDYDAVEDAQEKILQRYEQELTKHTTAVSAKKSKMIWDAIPYQLAKDNNKFIYAQIRAGARAKDLEETLSRLVDAGFACKQHLVTEQKLAMGQNPVTEQKLAAGPKLSLKEAQNEAYFKVYLSDVGLLRRKAKIGYQSILEQDALYHLFKTALTDNYVYTQLRSMGIETCFWRTKADAEIGFLTDLEGVLTPIEVRNAENSKAKSLHLFCDRYRPKLAIKTSLKNVENHMDGDTHVWNVPLYLLFRLRGYIMHEVGWPS